MTLRNDLGQEVFICVGSGSNHHPEGLYTARMGLSPIVSYSYFDSMALPKLFSKAQRT